MTVVVGWTSSDEGAAALQVGAAEARLRGLTLAVVDLGATDDGGAGARAAVQQLEPAPAETAVLPRPEHQDPTDALLDSVRERDAALVVVGARRRSPVGKFLLGSTAQRIILGSDAPVLVVKADRAS